MYRKGLYCATKMYYHEDVLPQGSTAKIMPPRMYCIGLTAQDVSPTMYRKGLHRTDSSKECATGCTGRRMYTAQGCTVRDVPPSMYHKYIAKNVPTGCCGMLRHKDPLLWIWKQE